ncbi:MAG: hypothetical protein ACI910_002729 [Oleispira sp.]
MSIIKRVIGCDYSASNTDGEPPTTHSAGRCYQLYLKNEFCNAFENLQFEFVVTDSDDCAVHTEYLELVSYIENIGELQLLNNQLPKTV